MRARLNLGGTAMRGYSAFLKPRVLQEPHPQNVCCVSRTLVGGGGLTRLQRCSRYILHPRRLGSEDLGNLNFFSPFLLLYIAELSLSCHIWNTRCPRCNGYGRRKWTRRHEFKSRTRLMAFHIALIPFGKVWIQLFSLQLWVNSRVD